MNATKYYVAACRLVMQANPDAEASWADVYRVLPMLRNSLSCTVCENLLVQPYTPEETSCEHHVCKGCRGGVKKLRPSCSWCKDYTKYAENLQLRFLIHSYVKLCAFIKITRLYALMQANREFGQEISEIIREAEESVAGRSTSLSSPPLHNSLAAGKATPTACASPPPANASSHAASSPPRLQVKREVLSEIDGQEMEDERDKLGKGTEPTVVSARTSRRRHSSTNALPPASSAAASTTKNGVAGRESASAGRNETTRGQGGVASRGYDNVAAAGRTNTSDMDEGCEQISDEIISSPTKARNFIDESWPFLSQQCFILPKLCF